MIRTMTRDDIPRLVELGRQMQQEAPTYRPFNFNGEKLAQFFEITTTDRDDVLAVVYEVNGVVQGLFMGIVIEHYFGDDLCAADHVLFVAKEARGSMGGVMLVKRYIEWAKSKGAKQIIISNSSGVETEKVFEMYKKLGFKRDGYVCSIVVGEL